MTDATAKEWDALLQMSVNNATENNPLFRKVLTSFHVKPNSLRDEVSVASHALKIKNADKLAGGCMSGGMEDMARENATIPAKCKCGSGNFRFNMGNGFVCPSCVAIQNQPLEYTGGSVSYYTVTVEKPTILPKPYTVECNDIIEALEMTFAEGNAFKAIWRLCAARLGKAKDGYRDGLYDAEKVVFFGRRMVEQAKAK